MYTHSAQIATIVYTVLPQIEVFQMRPGVLIEQSFVC